MISPDVLFDKIAGFQSADDLANYFKCEGIQGQPQSETKCPIAEYFSLHTQERYVSVNEDVTVSSSYPVWEDDEGVGWKKECSEVMKAFIEKFDESGYPDLIECEQMENCSCPTCWPEAY